MRRRDVIAGFSASATVWPGFTLAQSSPTPIGRLPIVGVLAVGGSEMVSNSVILSALAALGWVDGRNTRIAVREGDGRIESLTPFIHELLNMPADVIVARGGLVAGKLLEATRTTPIVVSATSLDPVRLGWAESYAKPARNVTGLTLANDEAISKQVQLLKYANPRLRHLALLKTRGNPWADDLVTAGKAAASEMGLRASFGLIAAASEVEPEIDRLRNEGVEGLLALADPVIDNFRRDIAEAAIKRRLLSAGQISVYARAGFLITYAADFNTMHRRAAVYVDRILKGERPGDLPIERPSKFVFTLNLDTARRMDLVISPTLLSLADEVIE